MSNGCFYSFLWLLVPRRCGHHWLCADDGRLHGISISMPAFQPLTNHTDIQKNRRLLMVAGLLCLKCKPQSG